MLAHHRRWTLAALAVVTVALVLPSAAADRDGPQAWGVALELDRAAGPPLGFAPVERAACSGFAPPIYACTTGLHTNTGGTINLSLAAQNYVGTLENRLDWSYGSLVFRCDVQGASASCTVTGGFPPFGVTMLHNCRSYQLGTSVPGGSGGWSCAYRQS